MEVLSRHSCSYLEHPIYRPACRLAGSLVACDRTSRHLRRATEGEDPPSITGDWRAFRAGLIAKTEGKDGGAVCKENLDLLRQQNAQLADAPIWAHSVEQVESGCVLLATERAPGLLNDPRIWQLVVFVTEHGAQGSRGLILNRPAVPLLADLVAFAKLEGDLEKIGRVFAQSTIYLGSMYSANKIAQQRLTILHPHKQLLDVSNAPLQSCTEVVPGVYMGGELSGAAAVEAGALEADTFRFFAGLMEWAPGALSLEINSGIWHTAACSPNLIVKHCLQLPVPLWQELMAYCGQKI